MSSRNLPHLALLGATLFWGFSFVCTKMVLQSFSPFVYVFLRLGAASLFFLLILLRKQRRSSGLSGKDHASLLLLALFQPGLYFTFETIGLQHTTASKASIIIALIPMAVMLLARRMIGERVGGKRLVSIALSIAGITILVAGDPGFNWSLKGSLYGDLLILLAVFAASFYIVLARDLGKKLSAVTVTSYQFIYGTLFFAPLFWWQLPQVAWERISEQAIAALVFLVLFATIGAFLLYNYALTKIVAAQAALFLNGIPVITAFGAWLVLGERLTAVQIGGGLLVLFAVYLATVPLNSGRRRAVLAAGWKRKV